MFESLFQMPLTQQFLAGLLTIGSAEILTMDHLLLIFGASSGDPVPTAQPKAFISHFYVNRSHIQLQAHISNFHWTIYIQVLSMTRPVRIVFLFPFRLLQM